MPRLDKEAFSRYLRSNCQRQLRLYMYRQDNQAAERRAQEPPVPTPQPPRPGLQLIRDAGEEWARQKLGDLYDTFPHRTLVGDAHKTSRNRWRYRETPLAAALARAQALLAGELDGCFLVESAFAVGPTFKAALGISHLESQYGLEYSGLRTDLIEVRRADGQRAQAIDASGELVKLLGSDTRLRLSVSEIKLQSEPSANYFAEVVFYAMTLAGWLVDQGLDSDFAVTTDHSFIWKGSTAASALRTCIQDHQPAGAPCTYNELRAALDDDVEPVSYAVFVPRVHNFFSAELPEVLHEPDWTQLDWHVDNRCTGCVFAGFPWGGKQNDHCIPSAEREGHLSRVAYVGRGAKVALRQSGIENLVQLAGLAPTDDAFDRHQDLRATRTVIADRVKVLTGGQAAAPATDSGSSAVMPKFANLKFFITTHFDPSSAVSISFALSARWVEPYGRHQDRERGVGTPIPWETHQWRPEVWVVGSKDDPADEEQSLLALLERIKDITDDARRRDGAANNRTTVQFYLWDQLEVRHFSRVMGRHLEAILANDDVTHLAWLFPTEEVLPNYEQVSQRSPLTVVSDVVRAVLAAPVSHVYSLLPLARAYHPDWSGASTEPSWWGKFSVHPLFEDPFSDQVPAERIHEIWSRSTTPSWGQRQAELVETVTRRLSALENVTQQLSYDLKPVLRATAPTSQVGTFKPLDKVGFDGQLWYAYAKLNAALDELEILRTRAMPPHEREARLRSALLEDRLHGADEQQALLDLRLSARPGRRIYKLAEKSQEVRLRQGEFNVALAPLYWPHFLDEKYGRVVAGTTLDDDPSGPNSWDKMDKLCKVDVVAVDRERQLIALDPNRMNSGTLDALEAAGVVDFSRHLSLDPVPSDFFTKPLRETLQAIGNPRLAANNPVAPRVRQATGQMKRRGARTSPDSPAAEVLWAARALHDDRQTRTLDSYRQELDTVGIDLDDSQWHALVESLQRKVSLIWGPPGTGKSQTVRGLLLVAVLDALAKYQPLRVLLTAGTYAAVDNVLLPLIDELARLLPGGADVELHRLRSGLSAKPDDPRARDIDRAVNRVRPDDDVKALRRRLHEKTGITLVAATTQQAHNLLIAEDGADKASQQEMFDLIALDEASQVDVGHAILALAGRAASGRVVFAGDHLQLDPIHKAEAPLGLDAMVGSVYGFMRDHHGIQPQMLRVNYRSNETIVEFAALHAGYSTALKAHAPNLRLQLDGAGRPHAWPPELLWTPELDALVDADRPAVAFVYPDRFWSSQWNIFEADTVASILCLLRQRQLNALAHEVPPRHGTPVLWDDDGFWDKGVGVVTPHRAQQALIVKRLQQTFPNVDSALLRGAVDTVERFQGQQRQVIIASFALGDPDAIRDEEEFLMSLNRFNVMASRARAKFIVLVSQAVVDHLAGDIEVLRGSGLLKSYVATFCKQQRPMQLGHLDGSATVPVLGQFRHA